MFYMMFRYVLYVKFSAMIQAALRNATPQAQVEMFEQEMTRMKLSHQLEMKEAVQKLVTFKKDKPDFTGNEKPSTSPAQVPDTVQSPGGVSRQPETMAQEDRILAKQSSENCKEIGSELKLLLSEMRNMITEKKDSKAEQPLTSKRYREVKERNIKKRSKPRYRPRTLDLVPSEKQKAFSHYRVPPAPSDISYYSDGEADERTQNRSRSLTGTYALYSPGEKEKTRKSSTRKHRRSRSAEMPSILQQDSNVWTDSDYRTSDYSPPGPDSDIVTDTNTSIYIETTDVESTISVSQDFVDSDIVSSLCVGSPIMESTQEDHSPLIAMPNTQELCKRLEERIVSLTKMGDNLQKENKEMADLMKTQGKKLKKVKENEKRIRKSAR